MNDQGKPRVVIIGSGFGGLSDALTQADAPVDVLLIDRNNYHTFVALIYQLAAAAVAHLWGRNFTGFPAWLIWLIVHLIKLIGFRNRLLVLINWAWDYLLYERAVRLILPLVGRSGE